MESQSLRVGITLDGSVSAGAYIAGVMDYLLETLDKWEEAKKSNDPSIPKHSVVVDVVTGASGGGITAGVTALCLYQQRFPATSEYRNNEVYLKKNKLYDTWVNLNNADAISSFMSTDDLSRENKVVSMLNSDFIEDIVKRVICYNPDNKESVQAGLPAYISPGMKLLMSLSNLEGYQYNIDFSGCGSTSYSMTQHRDYAFFRLGKEYDGKGNIPFYPPENIGLAELCQAAPSTSAFPVGLAYRLFERKLKYVLDNPFLHNMKLSLMHPDPKGDPESSYSAYFVDGGMLNNEPFDMAEKIIQEDSDTEEASKPAKPMEKDSGCFTKTIIMVEPFPSDDFVTTVKDQNGITSFASLSQAKAKSFPYTLWQVLSQVYKTMRSQLLFKEGEIEKAFDDSDYSRFIIAPRRRSGNDIYNGSIAIACGSLDGFGGFLDKEFRRHDFFLGRENCQGFLNNYFCVPIDTSNAIFKEGYSEEAKKRFATKDQKFIPIIPIVDYKEEPVYAYPIYSMQKWLQYKDAVLNRLESIGLTSIKGPLNRMVFRFAFRLKKMSLFTMVTNVIEEQLGKWKLFGN